MKPVIRKDSFFEVKNQQSPQVLYKEICSPADVSLGYHTAPTIRFWFKFLPERAGAVCARTSIRFNCDVTSHALYASMQISFLHPNGTIRFSTGTPLLDRWKNSMVNIKGYGDGEWHQMVISKSMYASSLTVWIDGLYQLDVPIAPVAFRHFNNVVILDDLACLCVDDLTVINRSREEPVSLSMQTYSLA